MHLVVLQHGVRGRPSDTKYLADLLADRLGKTGYVLNFAGNTQFATCDGIDICGERLFQGVKSAHDNLVHQGKPPTHISFIGYCMGGLITRYAVGRLFSEGYFDHVTPLNFITIATPHLGSWRHPTSIALRMMNAFVPAGLARAGAQLYLRDKTPWGAPLLCVLSHPGLNFMAAVRGFKNIVAMANVRHDRVVTFCSATMELEDPYPLRGFEDAVAPVDPTYASIVRPRNPGETPADPSPARRPLHGRFLLAMQNVLTVLLFPLAMLVPLLKLMHGRFHSCRVSKAKTDSVLQDVYTSWSDGGAGGVGGGVDRLRKSLQGPEPPGAVYKVDVESGLQYRSNVSSTVGAVSSGVSGMFRVASVGATAAVTISAVAGTASLKVGADDRVPLHKEHIRQQLDQGLWFEGLPPVTDKRGLQEWLGTQLATLQARKVHVDTRNVLNAHRAIIVASRLYRHCGDVMEYLLDRCMIWS